VARHTEVERLRADRDAAVAAAREAEHEVGRLRGQIAEMQVQLVRARQDQERYQVLLDRYRSVRTRAGAIARRLGRGPRR
jgi:multidrug resistance efflux pump